MLLKLHELKADPRDIDHFVRIPISNGTELNEPQRG